MSDRDQSYLVTAALGSGDEADTASLVWRCAGNTIELVLQAPELMGLGGPVPIRWRFDDEPASDRDFWRVSSLEPLGHAPEETIYPFSEVATEAQTVLLRTETADGRRTDHRFALRGLIDGLNRLSCGQHLEVLGERRAAALIQQASTGESLSFYRDGGLAKLIEEFPFVGHRTRRRYLRSDDPCWRTLWRVEEVAFFREEREARVEGFARGESCT